MKYKALDSQKVFWMMEQSITEKLQAEQEKKMDDYFNQAATATQKEIEEITKILGDLKEV